MADWDSADLLARCKRQAMEPDVTAVTLDVDWYAMLTEGEAHWKPVVAAHYPGPMYAAPSIMVATAEPTVFTFQDPANPGAPIEPCGQVEIYAAPRARLLRAGAYWDPGADFVMEGDKIRLTNGRIRNFPDGAPYARYVLPPTTIDAATDSTILPPRLRGLIVYHALYAWASRGGFQDPQFYRALEQRAAFGDPDIAGDVGLIGALKLQNTTGGMAGYSQSSSREWWRPV